MKMSDSQPRQVHSRMERAIGAVLFSNRWLLAPLYLGLGGGLVLILFRFVQHLIELLMHVPRANEEETIIGVLTLIDLSLMGNLVVMVMFAGYENCLD
ncbi:MAG: YqhA family protein [Bryobacteraceae bacterium]